MSDVPVPYLDDLRFQELVDEAKRYLPLRAPAWTDHNVSDPGITLVEACAARVDQLSYRTNQVPDAVRARLLRLAGLTPTPPCSARVTLTFSRTGGRRPWTGQITIPAGTAVTTGPAYPGQVITFRTVQDLVIPKGTDTGDVDAVNLVTVDEVLGVSAGEPGQRFSPTGTPFLSASPDGTQLAALTVTVTDQDGTSRDWTQVATFADASDADFCFLWDAVAHQVAFGPDTPYAAGGRQHGAVPVRGAAIHARYDTSQGSLGNLPAGALVVWDRSVNIPVTNAAPATGGADVESVPEAVARTNAVLVPLDRAVTAEDYAQVLTRSVPGVARVCTAKVPGQPKSTDPGYLQVTVVPAPSGQPGEPLPDTDLKLSADTAAAAGQCGERVRLLCARVQVADPTWVPLSVTATVYSWAGGNSLAGQAGQQAAQAALFRYFSPSAGGPDGKGWPFGRPVHVGDAYEVLASRPEIITVVDVAITNQAGTTTSWIDVPAQGLPLLTKADVAFVASGTEEFERVPPGMWGLFDGTDGTGKLLGYFAADAADLETGVGLSAASLVNSTSYTVEVFSLPRTQPAQDGAPATIRQVSYPGAVLNLGGVLSSATMHIDVPDGTYCLYEHPHQAGRQWLFWPADGAIDLALPGTGAKQTISSVLNRTTGTVELRGDDSGASPGAGQLVRPGETADLDAALNDKARFATVLDGPADGQYGLTVNGADGAEHWVFDASVPDLRAMLGDRTVAAVTSKAPYPLAMYPLPSFTAGAVGLQSVAPRSAADVRDAMAGAVASAQTPPLGSVMAWGDPASGLTDIPSGLTDVSAVAAGSSHWLALGAEGSVTARGSDSYGQSSVPPALSQVAAVAAGAWHSLALTADGTVTAWGDNSQGQSTIPAGLGDVVAIAAGGWHSLALTADGTVTAWGDQTGSGGANQVPAGLSDVVGIATGLGHSLAVKSDGTVTAWGTGTYGETVVPDGLAEVIAVAAGMWVSLALRADGTVVAWGYQTGQGGVNQVPAGLAGIVAIATVSAVGAAAGAPAPVPDAVMAAATAAMRSLALRADGTVVTWGAGTGAGGPYASPDFTAARSVAIAAGETCSLAICITK